MEWCLTLFALIRFIKFFTKFPIKLNTSSTLQLLLRFWHPKTMMVCRISSVNILYDSCFRKIKCVGIFDLPRLFQIALFSMRRWKMAYNIISCWAVILLYLRHISELIMSVIIIFGIVAIGHTFPLIIIWEGIIFQWRWGPRGLHRKTCHLFRSATGKTSTSSLRCTSTGAPTTKKAANTPSTTNGETLPFTITLNTYSTQNYSKLKYCNRFMPIICENR